MANNIQGTMAAFTLRSVLPGSTSDNCTFATTCSAMCVEDDALAERLRTAARRWTEAHYDSHRNAARLAAAMEQAVQAARAQGSAL